MELSPAAIGAARVAVTTWPEALKFQPAPAPLVNAIPAGSVSVTVVAPEVAAVPWLWVTKV